MKQYIIIIITLMSLLACKPGSGTLPPLPPPWDKGAFETQQYRNLFAEAGYPQAEIDAKLNQIFYNLFEGPNKV